MHRIVKRGLLLGLTGGMLALAVGAASAVDRVSYYAPFQSNTVVTPIGHSTPQVTLFVDLLRTQTRHLSSPGPWGHRAESYCWIGPPTFGPWRTAPSGYQTSTTTDCPYNNQFLSGVYQGRAWFRLP